MDYFRSFISSIFGAHGIDLQLKRRGLSRTIVTSESIFGVTPYLHAMNRRRLFAAGAAAIGTSVAGCLSGDDTDTDGNGAEDDDGSDSNDGYGPEPDTVPEERSIDTESYETATFEGIDVPLAPLEDVIYWYRRQEVRIVDARGSQSFEDSRITGAVLSSAPDGVDPDPVTEWSTDDRIVTYCVCPHAMAGQRAGMLIDAGYEHVYALDEGFEAWVDAGYPIEGAAVEGGGSASLPAYEVRGESDPTATGEYVTVRTVHGDQREMSVIDDDGSYELTLHFTGLEGDSLLAVETPAYTRELTLSELTSDVVTA